MKILFYTLPILIIFNSKIIQAETIYNCIVKDVVHLTDRGGLMDKSLSGLSSKVGHTFTISDKDGVMHGQVINSADGFHPNINIAKGMFTSLVIYPKSGRITDLRIHLWKKSKNKPFIYIDDFGENIATGICIKQ